MKIAICDDDAVFRQQLKTELEKYYPRLDVLIRSFLSGEDLIKSFESNAYDLIFLDIEMPGMDGFETARKLREKQPEVTILFLTSHTELAMDGYEVQAFRFLAKPVERKKLYAALRAFEEKLHKDKKIVIVEDGTEKIVRCQEICYIKSENVYLSIVTKRERYFIRKKRKDLLEELPKETFVPVHRSFIVNLEYVKSFSGSEIILENHTKIPVSRGKRDLFKQQMMKYMRGK